MSIRFKTYQINDKSAPPIKAIRLTERNLVQVVDYVNRNGGEARGHNTGIQIRQLNFGENWGKRDWRVAKPGDFVLFIEDKEKFDGVTKPVTFRDYFRIKEDHFEASHTEVK